MSNDRVPEARPQQDYRMAFCPACFVEVTPEQAGAQINAAWVLAEFAKTAPGRLPQRVQDAIKVVNWGVKESQPMCEHVPTIRCVCNNGLNCPNAAGVGGTDAR